MSEQPATEATPAAGDGGSAALEVESVSSGYGATTIIRDVTLTVPSHSVAALIGSNGAGKTTLLKTIAGTIRPSRGTIRMDGHDVTKLSPAKRHRMGACVIPEGRGVFRSLTVRENLELQARRGEEKAAIERAVSAFPPLAKRMTFAAGTLSGGEQQMLAMAQAYVKRPRLVLVDEASLGLAPLVVDVIFDFLQQVTKDGTSLLIVDQFVTRVLGMANVAFVLRRGEIVYSGDPGQLLAGDIFHQYLGLSSTTDVAAPGSTSKKAARKSAAVAPKADVPSEPGKRLTAEQPARGATEHG
jgi:branched-chain amino acid transport system ATP-binding protein